MAINPAVLKILPKPIRDSVTIKQMANKPKPKPSPVVQSATRGAIGAGRSGSTGLAPKQSSSPKPAPKQSSSGGGGGSKSIGSGSSGSVGLSKTDTTKKNNEPVKVTKVVSMTVEAYNPNTDKKTTVGTKNINLEKTTTDLQNKGFIITRVSSGAKQGAGASYSSSAPFEYTSDFVIPDNRTAKQKAIDEMGYYEVKLNRPKLTQESLIKDVNSGRAPPEVLAPGWSPVKEYEKLYKVDGYIWEPSTYKTWSQIQGKYNKTPKNKDLGQGFLDRYNRQKNKPGMSAVDFLIKKAEPKESKQLESNIKIMDMLKQKTDSSIFNRMIDNSFNRAYTRAYESLTPQEKAQYGVKYTEWDKIPLGARQFYPGYNLAISNAEKTLMVYEYEKSKEFQDYLNTDKGKKQLQAVEKGNYDKMLEEKNLVSAVSVYDTQGARYDIARARVTNLNNADETLYKNMGFRARALTSANEAMISAVSFPVTLPQAVIKHFNSGKTLFLPDVGEQLNKTKVSPTQGIIGGTVGEVISGGASDFDRTIREYPIETGFASFGEVVGIMVGGKLVNIGKVGTGKVLNYSRNRLVAKGINVPSVSNYLSKYQLAQYKPTNLLRKAWWKGKEKLGLAKQLDEPIAWNNDVLFNDAKFSTLKGARNQLKKFESTQKLTIEGTVTDTPGDILAIHASPGRFKWLTKLGKGSSESPGLSVSAYGEGSPHFLQIDKYSGGGYASEISLLPRLKLPTAPVIRLKNVFRIPKKLIPKEHSTVEYSKSGNFILSQPKGKYGWIAPKTEMGSLAGKTNELEAIIRGGSFLKRSSNRYFTTYRGVVVPLPEYTILNRGMPSTFGVTTVEKTITKVSMKIPESTKSFFSMSSSSGASSISVLNPSYLLSSAFSKKAMSSFKSKNSYSFSKSSKKSSSRYSPSSYSYSPSSYSYSPSSSIGSSIMSSMSSSLSSMSSSLSSMSSSSSSSSSYGSSSGSSGSSSSSSYYNPQKRLSSYAKMSYRAKSRRKLPGFTSKSLLSRYRYREFGIPDINKIMGRLKI